MKGVSNKWEMSPQNKIGLIGFKRVSVQIIINFQPAVDSFPPSWHPPPPTLFVCEDPQLRSASVRFVCIFAQSA